MEFVLQIIYAVIGFLIIVILLEKFFRPVLPEVSVVGFSAKIEPPQEFLDSIDEVLAKVRELHAALVPPSAVVRRKEQTA